MQSQVEQRVRRQTDVVVGLLAQTPRRRLLAPAPIATQTHPWARTQGHIMHWCRRIDRKGRHREPGHPPARGSGGDPRSGTPSGVESLRCKGASPGAVDGTSSGTSPIPAHTCDLHSPVEAPFFSLIVALTPAPPPSVCAAPSGGPHHSASGQTPRRTANRGIMEGLYVCRVDTPQ